MGFPTCVLHLSILLIGGVSSMLQYKEGSSLKACYTYQSPKNESIIENCSKAFRMAIEETGRRLNFTERQINYVLSLEREMQGIFHKQRRVRRQSRRPQLLPVRRECRLLSERERSRIFRAIRTIKFTMISNTPPTSEYDTLADLHKGMTVDAHAHRGSNFLGWHRVYLVFYELALRRKCPGITLCFWDSTFDFRLGSGSWRDTAIFSSSFFGNREGQVITGPFANWPMPPDLQSFGPFLTRDLGGSGGMPIDSRAAASIFYNPNTLAHTQITTGGSGFDTIMNMAGVTRDVTIESEHDNVHRWIGRAMGFVDSAPQDPIFYFHHCYIDYMWERFREKMKFYGRVPSVDYPGHSTSDPSLHEANYPMIGFPGFRNIDGYSEYFTTFLYRYETPYCFACLRSPYATCDRSGQCVARTIMPGTEMRRGPWAPGTEPGSAKMAAFDRPAKAKFVTDANADVRVQTPMGRRFPESSRTE